MHYSRPSFASLALAACLLFAAVHASFAGTHKYPPDDPSFVFDLPDDWVTQQRTDEHKTLVCSLKSDDNVGIIILTSPKAYTSDEFKVFLPAMAKSQLESQKATGIDIKDPDDDKIGGGMSIIFVIASATTDGTPFIYSFMGFTPVTGKSYIVEHIVPAKDYKAHMSELQDILGSFKALK